VEAAGVAPAGKGAKKGAPAPAATGVVEPRICDDDMIELCKLALAKPDCQNLGFVLDGFPKTYALL
jgi:adenylate kinase family enzyme